MRHSQRGVTFIGWLFLLTPMAIVVYAGIRVTPIYLNYYRVSSALMQLNTDFKNTTVTPEAVRNALEKRFDVEYVDHPASKDIDVHRDGDVWKVVADYSEDAPLLANLSLHAEFHKEVTLE